MDYNKTPLIQAHLNLTKNFFQHSNKFIVQSVTVYIPGITKMNLHCYQYSTAGFTASYVSNLAWVKRCSPQTIGVTWVGGLVVGVPYRGCGSGLDPDWSLRYSFLHRLFVSDVAGV